MRALINSILISLSGWLLSRTKFESEWLKGDVKKLVYEISDLQRYCR